MAISLLEQNQNEDENKREISSLPVLGGDRGSAFSTGMSQNSPAGKGSGRFTNLKKYIEANQQGASGVADRMGRAVDTNFNEYQKQFGNKVGEVTSGVNAFQQGALNEGNQYKDTLGSINNDLNTFQSMDDRETFNKGGQSLFDFNKNSGQKFNDLRSGLGLNQEQLQQSQGMNQAMNESRLKQGQADLQGIQNEQGRYNLLRQAQPKLGGYSTGQGRLDQLLFQSTPSAVSSLQNTFDQNLGKVKSNQAALDTVGGNLQTAIGQESDLMSGLQGSADTAQNSFVNQLNQVKNFNQINQERTNLYNDYLGQLDSGNISADLSAILGLQGMSTWNPTYNAKDSGGQFDIGGKLTPIGGGVPTSQNTLGPNQFRSYNALNSGINQDYIRQGDMANKFQDILTQPDYDVYQSLANLSGRDLGLASGKSQMGSSVVTGPASLANNITDQNTSFVDNASKNYQGIGGAARSWQTTPLAGIGESWTRGKDDQLFAQAGEGLNNRDVLQGVMNDPNGPGGDTAYNQGATASAKAENNLNDYLFSNQYAPNSQITDVNYGSYGDNAANTAAASSAQTLARSSLNDYLDNLINQSGVKNSATLNEENTADKYKRFNGLV